MRTKSQKQPANTSLPVDQCTKRYGRARRNVESFCMFLKKRGESDPTVEPYLRRMKSCGLTLTYTQRGSEKARLSGGMFCQHFLICPLCAMRRTTKFIYNYAAKIFHVLQDYPEARLFFVTLTLRPSKDLLTDVTNLRGYTTQLHKQGRDVRRGKLSGRTHPTEGAKIIGALQSIEVTEQKDNNPLIRPWLYQTHAHAIWLCDATPDKNRLSREWKEITGGSFYVDVQEIESDGDAVDYNSWLDSVGENLFDVCNYMLKVTRLRDAVRWDIFCRLKRTATGRCPTLIVPRGKFRGVKLPDENGELTNAEKEFEEVYITQWDKEQRQYLRIEHDLNVKSTVGTVRGKKPKALRKKPPVRKGKAKTSKGADP